MRTLAIVSRKGGTGKTTLAAQLAVGLWRRNRSVVLADLDPQRSAAEIMADRTSPGPAIAPVPLGSLSEFQARQKAAGVGVMILDTPAALEREIESAVRCADLSLLVVRPSLLDLLAAVHTARQIRDLDRPGLVVINQAPPPRAGVEPPIMRRATEALSLLGLPVSPAIIRSRNAHVVATERGQAVEEFAPWSPAAAEITALLADVSERLLAPGRADAAVKPTGGDGGIRTLDTGYPV